MKKYADELIGKPREWVDGVMLALTVSEEKALNVFSLNLHKGQKFTDGFHRGLQIKIEVLTELAKEKTMAGAAR